MIQNLKTNKILWIIIAALSLYAALMGVFKPEIYSKVVSREIMPGVMSQDLMTIFSGVAILSIVFLMNEKDTVKQIIVIGLLGYLFYAYGVYSIERIYNQLYLVYMAIFGLSFYSLIYGFMSIRRDLLDQIKVQRGMKYISVAFSLFIPFLFYPLWINQLIPILKTGQKIEFIYSIYILDMVFILPLFIIIPIMAMQNKGLGLLLTPILFIKSFTLLLSVGIGEYLKPFYDQPRLLADVSFYSVLAFVFLVLTIIYFKYIKISDDFNKWRSL